MYAWENTLNKVKNLTEDRYQTDVAMRVAVSIVGGRNARNIDQARLHQVVGALGLDPSNYTN